MCSLDFKGVIPSADYDQLVRTMSFLGQPKDVISIINNLYSGTTP